MKVDSLDTRLKSLEGSLTAIHLHEAQQTQLLQKLVVAQLPTPTQLDANKKGEKEDLTFPVSQGGSTSEEEQVLNIQVSKVIVPAITYTKPPVLDIIDLIQLAAAKLKSSEHLDKIDVVAVEQAVDAQWQKLGESIKERFGQIEKPDKTFHHSSQVKQILVNEMSLGNMENGQPSCIKSPKANLVFKPKRNYPKSSDKNPLDLIFETPRLDEKKLLARSIASFKDPTDSVLKRRIAKIYRNGKEICVVAGNPQFAEAKKEEKERIKQEKKQANLDAKKLEQKKKQDAIAKLQAVKTATEISEKQPVTAEARDQKMLNEPQQTMKPRYKQRIKRKLDFSDEELEDYIPKQSTSTTQTSKPSVVHEEFKVDPTKNFHGEPIISKDEPIDLESLPIPELNLPIFNKPKKTKSRAIKKVKPVIYRSKALTKAQPTVNKGDILYICDIKEFSEINLYMDELKEVRAIDAHRNLPERLVFKYKEEKEITWPLHRILQESCSVLIKIFSSFKKNFGFNVTAMKLVLNKIEDLRSNKAKDALPKTLSIPFKGKRVHLRPYWLKEFMDDKGVKRFFKLDDQLSISSNETLLEMQEKLDLSDAEELEFHRQLQNQIEENNRKLVKKSRQTKK